MYLDYSNLEFDKNGIPETPDLVLKTLSDKTIGVLSGVHNMKANIKLSEPSELTFDIPAVIDGMANPLYDRVTGRKIIYTKNYGVYVTMNPVQKKDGISDVKSVMCYSLEKRLEDKRFFLEEGTFNFWNPADPEDTVLGRIAEVAVGWSVGYVSPTLIGRYRTFEQYDDYLLSFAYSTAPKKYRCVFVFDPYEKTMNVYDADEERPTLPIYLDFDNLLENLEIEEISEELVTALRPYGADELDIRDVNPLGTNWIYDLSYFISNGDIPSELANKWDMWQADILAHQTYYKGLVGVRSSATARLLFANAELTDLEGELTDLENQQSITIQTLASESTSAGKATQQELLNEINRKIKAKKTEISTKKAEIQSIQNEIDADNALIQGVVSELSIAKYFTEAEYSVLQEYFVEQDMTEETFVATDVDTSVSGTSYTVASCVVQVDGSNLMKIDLTSEFGKQMYVVSGGSFSVGGDISLACDIIRGTLEVNANNSYVLSLYAGEITVNNKTATSGMITISGTLSSMTTDIHTVNDNGITTLEGTRVSFNSTSGALYLTANVSEYQKYSVQMELYDYATKLLHDVATATYEFSVDSGNFLFAKEFKPFRDKLELGKGVYLNVGERTITPLIIEFELDFEERDHFSILFSNRFKRHDSVNTLKDMVEESYSSSRSFDASKYIYNQAANQSAAVSQFMNSSLDAAKNTILAAANQSVRINGSGIHVGGDSKYQLRIVDSMIAMTDDNWDTVKLAVGLFSTEDIGTYWGVNAEVIGGKLIVGNNLVVENTNDDGVMQFKVDATGAWLNNSTFVLQKDNNGKIIIDPKYGILAGSGKLFTTSGTTVLPSFVDDDGDIIFDADGMPENSNFYLDIRDGSAYFRGKVKSNSGSIGGWTLAEDSLYSGSNSTYVALNSSKEENALYAIWAGASSPENANFWIKRDGTLHAKKGEFSGMLSAASLSGNLTADAKTGGWLIGCGINVNSGAFYVDQSGNVTMKGGINLTGNITWGTNNSPVRVLYARTQLSTPTGSYSDYPSSSSSDWHQTMSVRYDYYASYSYDGGQTWTAAVKIQGTDGQDGQDGVDGSDATVNERNVFNVLTNGGTKFGIFSDSSSNKLYINANYIRTGLLDADLLELTCGYGGFCKGRGFTGVSTTYGSMMYGSNGQGSEPYFIVTNTGCRMSAENDIDFFITGSGVYCSEDEIKTSDRRLKNSIEYNMDLYEGFFMKLKPTQFKYNRGSSDRYHVGFIAQDVEDALHNAGLTTSDFAGVAITPVEEVRSDGISDYRYGLRYGEFISLNTYMIQRLYRRIEVLEAQVKSMS